MKLISVEEMDKLDDDLRELIRKMWPVQARKKKLLNLLVPPNGGMYWGNTVLNTVTYIQHYKTKISILLLFDECLFLSILRER